MDPDQTRGTLDRFVGRVEDLLWSPCVICQRERRHGPMCEAFPKKIPEDILCDCIDLENDYTGDHCPAYKAPPESKWFDLQQREGPRWEPRRVVAVMEPMAAVVCGVDGCAAGWVAVWHDLGSQRIWWQVVSSLQEIAQSTPPPAVIGIDVPIGLLPAGARACDCEARRRLGFPRSASVFPAPIRRVLVAGDQVEASAVRRSIEGKGMTVQAWGIVPKVIEVDEALRADAGLRAVTREVHPELCFAGMNGGRPMVHSKKKTEGRAERVAVLREHFGDVIDNAIASKPKGCQYDDLLDAFACAWTAARIIRGEAEVIPTNPPPDDFGRPMEMVI